MSYHGIRSIKHEYFHWLCDIVKPEQESGSYHFLLTDLHEKEFISLVDHDENRAYDGIELRDEFLRELGYPKYTDIPGECSVLEMMVGLARRMDFETADPYDYDISDRTSHWFWEMVDNLGLSAFDDGNYDELGGYSYVDSVLETLVERKYLEDGYGGLFPLKRPSGDQRKVELWYQMGAYLRENEEI